MREEFLRNIINATGVNFQFTLGDEFKPIFTMLYEAVKHVDEGVATKRIQELWKTTKSEWDSKYGFRGYPNLASWIEILDKKPLTEVESAKKKREYQEYLMHTTAVINLWVNDPNLRTFFPRRYKNPDYQHIKFFPRRYKNPDYQHIKNILDKFWKVKEELTNDRIVNMAIGTKKKFLDDPVGFRQELMAVAREQSPLLLT
jgi:hypothetical protein